MLHDENDFGPNTEKFRPERFFEPVIADPKAVTFGFGRRCASSSTSNKKMYTYTVYRTCPGQHLADDSLWIAVASILKIYSISLAKDNEGNETPVEEKFTSGFIS